MPVAIITGASQGFGRALAIELVEQHWSVVIDARRPAPLDDVALELKSKDAHFEAIVGDITDSQHRIALARSANAFGGVDLVVHNASELGTSPLAALEHYDLEVLHRVYEVNVFAPLALTQLVLSALRKSKGSIVAISSDAAVEAYEHWGGYGSSKAALDQLQLVLGEEERDLSVYAFDPGDMRTAMHQAAFPGEDISDRPEPTLAASALSRLLAARPKSGRYWASDWLN